MSDLIKKTLKIKDLLSDKFYKESSVDSYEQENVLGEYPKDWIKINYKTYPRLLQIPLPKANKLNKNLGELLLSRRSRRDFSKKPIMLRQLATMLVFSSGISLKEKDWDTAIRTYPSAGARYPIEVYLIVNNVEGLKQGLYHFNVKNNSLELLRKEELKYFLSKNTGQSFVANSACVIILSAVLERTRVKYEERGYRFILMECGHVAQNLYLISEALSLKCCAIGGFVDEEFNNFLDLKDQAEKVMYLVAVSS